MNGSVFMGGAVVVSAAVLMAPSWTRMHTTMLVLAVAVAVVAGSCLAAFLTWGSVTRRIAAAGAADVQPARDIIDLQARAARRDRAEIGAAGAAMQYLDRYKPARNVPVTFDLEELGS